MDILIKNIELPKKYGKVLIIYHNGVVEEYKVTIVRRPMGHSNSVAIPLPEHGRLIDADELGYRTITDHNLKGHNVVDLEDIENAPTVLEASNG